jgi:orotidine-5'-phosphate decarboxylase
MIFVAIDNPDMSYAISLCNSVKDLDQIGIKLGLEFFLANGWAGVNAVEEIGLPVFLDLKLYDIPNTMAGAVRSIVKNMINLSIFTVHAQAGIEGLRAVMEALQDECEKTGKIPPKALAVTLLTSFEQDKDTQTTVLDLCQTAYKAGVDGVVSSPLETAIIRQKFPKLEILNPGIRPDFSKTQDDQSRTTTPLKAVQNGANYLVIGRPITSAPDPREACLKILELIRE